MGDRSAPYFEIEPGDRVRLSLPSNEGRDYIEIVVSKSDPGHIEVRVTDGTMVIRPEVSNKVSIGLETTWASHIRRHPEKTKEVEALETIMKLADPENDVGDRMTLTSCFEVARDALAEES